MGRRGITVVAGCGIRLRLLQQAIASANCVVVGNTEEVHKVTPKELVHKGYKISSIKEPIPYRELEYQNKKKREKMKEYKIAIPVSIDGKDRFIKYLVTEAHFKGVAFIEETIKNLEYPNEEN